MNDQEFNSLTVDERAKRRSARDQRSDREVLDAIETRIVRAESRIARVFGHLGFNVDGTRRSTNVSGDGVDKLRQGG